MSALGYRWVLNLQDLKNCTLLLKRLNLPKDIRFYMRRFMYDYVCPCNPTFYKLKTWSKDQAMIYEAFQNHPINFIGFPTDQRYGKTTVIQGIAETCIKNNVSVLVISKNMFAQNRMYFGLGDDTELLTLQTQHSRITQKKDVILVDDFESISHDFFFKQIIPLVQMTNVRVLCIGITNEFIEKSTEFKWFNVVQIKKEEEWKTAEKIKKLKLLY